MTMLLLVMSVPVYAGDNDMENNNVTPYGDYCRECTLYGICKEVIAPEDAVMVLDRYYRHKGYRLGTIYHRGRFIEAEIYKNKRQVDKVVFDRKTGRLRSIY
jgi:hypothetical protein